MSGGDFLVPVPASIEAPTAMPIETAISIVCEKLGLPLLGGPSGRGWSYHSTAQRCPHLFKVEQLLAGGHESRNPAVPLQVGALYHFLQALFYAPGLGPCAEYNKGLVAMSALDNRKGRKPKPIEIPPTAADDALAMLKDMAAPLAEDLAASVAGAASAAARPSADIIDQAERAFDAHTNYYGSDGREDVTPLAMEWYAENEALEYTCRYDMIARLGESDPLGLPAGSVVVFERKTAAYLSEMATTGWIMDGEILGQILNWQPSGCEQMFGPLAAVVVDVVTKKAKTPQFLRVVVPPTVPMVAEHGKWIRYTQAQMRMWQASNVYPRHFTQCFDRWGKCGLWESCARGDKL